MIFELMADCGAMGALPKPLETTGQEPHRTLLRGISAAGIDRSGSDIICVPNARHQMVERQRASDDDELCLGLDASNLAEVQAAGNAVCPPVSRWIAEKLIGSFE